LAGIVLRWGQEQENAESAERAEGRGGKK
jgi:hypothetical protein